MNTQKKAEWKGMFKGVVVTLLLLGVFSAGAVYAAVTLMTDEGFFVGDTSMTDGKVTINSTEITGDSFGDFMFFNHSFRDEKSYAVSAFAEGEGEILEIYYEKSFTPVGRFYLFFSPYVCGYVKTDDPYGNDVEVGYIFGYFDTQKSVGDDPWTGQKDNEYLYSYTYGTSYAQIYDDYDGNNKGGEVFTSGQTYYLYFYSFAYTGYTGSSNATAAYFTNTTARAIFF